jgi:hypothetical protein
MLTLLDWNKPLYINIEEAKVGKHHRIRAISLQTTDPAGE